MCIHRVAVASLWPSFVGWGPGPTRTTRHRGGPDRGPAKTNRLQINNRYKVNELTNGNQGLNESAIEHKPQTDDTERPGTTATRTLQSQQRLRLVTTPQSEARARPVRPALPGPSSNRVSARAGTHVSKPSVVMRNAFMMR
jgi:hypothetical protein